MQTLRPDEPGPLDSRGRLSPHEHLGYGAVGEDAHRTAAGTAALLDPVLRSTGVFLEPEEFFADFYFSVPGIFAEAVAFAGED